MRLGNGNLTFKDTVDLFLRYEGSRHFDKFGMGISNRLSSDDGYSVHDFVDREGSKVSFYKVMRNSPLQLGDLEVGDCVELVGKFAKYVTLRNGDEVTSINYVKITNNKGKKSS